MFELVLFFFSLATAAANELQPAVSMWNFTNEHGSVNEIVFPFGDQSNTDLAYLLTDAGHVFMTRDGGKSWTALAPMLSGFDEQKVAFMEHSPANGNYSLFVGMQNYNWVTRDGGLTFQHLNSSLSIEAVELHPTEPEWMLVSYYHPGCWDRDRWDECRDQSYVSKDFGQSFLPLLEYVWAVSWGNAGRNGLSPMTVYVRQSNRLTGSQFSGDSLDSSLWRVDDGAGRRAEALGGAGGTPCLECDPTLQATKYLLLNQSFGYVLSPRYTFAVTRRPVSPDTPQQLAMILHTSTDEGYSFRECSFPESLTPSSQITIMVSRAEAGESAIAIALWSPGNNWGNLYLSDGAGVVFTRVVDRVHRTGQHRYAMYRPRGVEGIVFVNQAAPFDSSVRQTLVSTDNGGLWQPLRAPANHSCFAAVQNMANVDPAEQCGMHLQFSRPLQPITSAHAVGVLLAHGNVGPQTSAAVGQLRPFLSRDAGQTWMETLGDEAYVGALGSFGSVLALTPVTGSSRQLLYTVSQGAEWGRMDNAFPVALRISDVYAHGSLAASSVLFAGERADNGIAAVVHVDFAPLQLRRCQGSDAPGTPGSDYEWYTPSTTASGCLLGRVVQFVRRKADAQCVDLTPPVERTKVEHCECTNEDWECDYGFTRSPLPPYSDCVRDVNSVPWLNPTKPCFDGTGAQTYVEPSGYRLVPGNKCVDGVQLGGTMEPCPAEQPTRPPTACTFDPALCVLIGPNCRWINVPFTGTCQVGCGVQQCLTDAPTPAPTLSPQAPSASGETAAPTSTPPPLPTPPVQCTFDQATQCPAPEPCEYVDPPRDPASGCQLGCGQLVSRGDRSLPCTGAVCQAAPRQSGCDACVTASFCQWCVASSQCQFVGSQCTGLLVEGDSCSALIMNDDRPPGDQPEAGAGLPGGVVFLIILLLLTVCGGLLVLVWWLRQRGVTYRRSGRDGNAVEFVDPGDEELLDDTVEDEDDVSASSGRSRSSASSLRTTGTLDLDTAVDDFPVDQTELARHFVGSAAPPRRSTAAAGAAAAGRAARRSRINTSESLQRSSSLPDEEEVHESAAKNAAVQRRKRAAQRRNRGQ